MATDGTKVRFLLKLVGIAVGFTLGIAACYRLLPASFSGHKNMSVLIFGLFGAYLSGGYVGFNFFEGSTLGKKTMLGVACGVGVAVFVLCFSMVLMRILRGP